MFCRIANLRVPFAALACVLLTHSTVFAGTMIGIYAPGQPGSTRYFAAVFEGKSDIDRQETAIACTDFVNQNNVTAPRDGGWLACPYLVESQMLMIGCVGPDGVLQFYVTACCHGNNICASGYRRDAEAMQEFIPPGRGRDFRLGWEEITIGNFYDSFNIQFRCQTIKH